MATATGKTAGETQTNADLEADIRQLKADIEKLTKQLAKTGEHGYGTARRAAAEGVEQLRAPRVRLPSTACAATPRTSKPRSPPMCAKSR